MQKTIFLFWLLFLNIAANAQEVELSRVRGVDVYLSAVQISTPRYAKYPFTEVRFIGEQAERFLNFPSNKYWMYRIGGNYQIHRFIRVGLWGSYGYIQSSSFKYERNPIGLKTDVFGGGVKASTHLLPLLFEKYRDHDPRVDIYVSTELGGFYFKNKWEQKTLLNLDGSTETYYPDLKEFGGGHSMKALATVGGGVFFYIWDGLGVYFDYQYGGFLTKRTLEESRAVSVPKVGLTFRF
jgi:hypothetical protein